MSANDFFLSPEFAVAGASADEHKFGYKVLSWYKRHDLIVTPINPPILGLEPVAQLSDLKKPQDTSISVITPPKVTLSILEQAEALGVSNIWLQPGTFDDTVMQRVRKLEGKINVIAQGRCILVEGSEDLAIAVAHGGRKL
ncbi:Putative uncharacterized protein [Taphrina deformans PYCC 5710]|uniref:CoA-binding domain-containing protein n=1 Tax=Taphrina deformans (strain PYCC 5710 / ATCC 11124 / CBS 356.35 / IMI 108563 / JCM 9778 / NBRC 8474) TaxID=1097556 RepID=R4X935_TAPDE|nr:Putative uncharacterized protein [Taphrina deformans PYCC 5710]|eukprot:CCG80672.1 Putative uncharacterized protein [Taphrina deformans PYCC 5710]